MAEQKKPVKEVSAAEAEELFANAAKALGGSRGRSAGFRRVSIPVSEPVRPDPLPKTAAVEEPVKEPEPVVIPAPQKLQSERKAWYLRKKKEEEEQDLPISRQKLEARKEARAAEAAAEEDDVRVYEPSDSHESSEVSSSGYDFGATTVIPSAVTFDYGEEYEDYDEDYEYTDADLEEEVAFSALEQALNRHADVYGDPRKNRRNRYHDYGFGMGITFDGPSYYEDDEDDI